ncbi:MAG: succinylglutamate desuccinylase/aspartoacylase family protein [Pirellulaceae bacterium]
MDLTTLLIEGSLPGPHLLITGGVHGDEFESMVAIRRLARVVDKQRLRGRLTLVPVVNEPAFLRGSRTAEDGLDLARTCPGKVDGTVTEQIAHALSNLIRAADFYIDLHTGGTTLSVWPLAGYIMHPQPRVLDQQRRMAQAFNLPVIWGTDYRLNGRSLSVARDAEVPAIYCEYLGGARCEPAGIEAYVDGCLNVMSVLEMIDRPRPPRRVEHVVEDDRPSSGHMQICNPAPMTGLFEPAIALGDWIEAGQELGTISDVAGQHVERVVSRQSGRVIVLRTFARVIAGDSLAVIMESLA